MEVPNDDYIIAHDIDEIKRQEKYLVGDFRRYYEKMPDICWMSEQTLAKKLRFTRQRVRTVKHRLVDTGLIELNISRYKSGRIRHLQQKINPILNHKGEDYERYEIVDDVEWAELDNYMQIKWELLQSFTAEELNKMSKPDLVKLYQECNFIVLPSVYPIVTRNGVVCSCFRGRKCASPGKHPVHAYKYIDSERYESLKERYLNEFVKNPELNVGVKVSSFSVLDVDGPAGKQSLDELTQELEYEGDVDTLKGAITASSANGLHIYVNNTSLRNNASVIADGLDIRSEGGFLVLPGSRHKSGRDYTWRHIGDVGHIPEEWLADRPTRSGNQRKRNNLSASIALKDIKLPRTLSPDYSIPQGQRELTLFKWAARIRGQGGNKAHIVEELMFIRDTFCEFIEDDEIPDNHLVQIADYCVRHYQPN